MGDMWADCVPDEWIRLVLEHLHDYDDGRHLFYFLTKNPQRYHDYTSLLPRHSLLGTTIETNRDHLIQEHNITNAPPPSQRYKAHRSLNWHWKNITIEPILDFDPPTLKQWIHDINPVHIYIGYDNLRTGLPEPPPKKTQQLVRDLEKDYFIIYRPPRRTWRKRGAD